MLSAQLARVGLRGSLVFLRIAAVHGKPWPAANRKADWHVGTFFIVVTMCVWSSLRVMGARSLRFTFSRVRYMLLRRRRAKVSRAGQDMMRREEETYNFRIRT